MFGATHMPVTAARPGVAAVCDGELMHRPWRIQCADRGRSRRCIR